MMSDLVEAERRGVPIIAINPMPERALIRFTPPQDVIEMATFGSTRIASDYVPIGVIRTSRAIAPSASTSSLPPHISIASGMCSGSIRRTSMAITPSMPSRR